MLWLIGMNDKGDLIFTTTSERECLEHLVKE